MKSKMFQPSPRARPRVFRTLPSIFNMLPSTNYATLIPRRTAVERMEAAWERTGRQMQTALTKVKVGHEHRPVDDTH